MNTAPRTSFTASAVLAAIGGFVDAACFLGLFGVFTAHVTGNIAMIASEMVHHLQGILLRALVLPAFAGGIVSAYLLMSAGQPASSDAALRRGLLVQIGWFGLLLAALAVLGSPATARDAAAFAVTFCAGAGMGAQSATSKLSARLGNPTSVMTSNYTLFVIGAVDALRGQHRDPEHARQLRLLGTLLLSFAAGAAAGAMGEARFGFGVLGLPLLGLVGLLGWLMTQAAPAKAG
jgi:uncharacterized membrane protein YoaK (UPF0700 family)